MFDRPFVCLFSAESAQQILIELGERSARIRTKGWIQDLYLSITLKMKDGALQLFPRKNRWSSMNKETQYSGD